MLLQHGADPNIRNTDGKSALDLADSSAKAVLTGQSLKIVVNIVYCFAVRSAYKWIYNLYLLTYIVNSFRNFLINRFLQCDLFIKPKKAFFFYIL